MILITDATQLALDGLRDLTTLKWYVIPLLAIVFYIYTNEIEKAREVKNWNVLFAALTVFGMDFINETWNGWVLIFTDNSAFWTTPGETALRTMVGWNIEIMFMFLISGIIYAKTVGAAADKKTLGIRNDWFYAIGYSIFCVFIECLLNIGGHLVWEYPFWNLSFGGIWLIFLIGYFHFYVAALIVMRLKTIKKKVLMVSIIYAIAIGMNLFGYFMGWVY